MKIRRIRGKVDKEFEISFTTSRSFKIVDNKATTEILEHIFTFTDKNDETEQFIMKLTPEELKIFEY
jgi:hypothetical protein